MNPKSLTNTESYP